jgi:hypothetical protein
MNTTNYLHYKIRKNISRIKKLNALWMNKKNKTSYGDDFWWIISGRYALYAQYLIYYHQNGYIKILESIIDEGDINQNLVIKEITNRWLKYYGRTQIECNDYPIEECIDIANKAEINLVDTGYVIYEENERIEEIEYKNRPYQNLTLLAFRILKVIHFFKKTALKIATKLRKKEINKKITKRKKIKFEEVFSKILPELTKNAFPKWFVQAESLIKLNEYKTYFGEELNIFDKIIIAMKYEKYGKDWLKIIPHGGGLDCSIEEIYKYSITAKPQNHYNKSLLIEKHKHTNIKDNNYRILICPPQFPYVPIDIDINAYKEFLKDYNLILNSLVENKNKKRKIKIKYKTPDYLSGYRVINSEIERRFDIEEDSFEDVWHKYDLIICPNFGTIAAKCIYNNINFLCYMKPYWSVERTIYEKIEKHIKVYTNLENFITKLKDIENA